MNPPVNTDRHQRSLHHPGWYEQYQSKDGCNVQQTLEDMWSLPFQNHVDQHISSGRSPHPMTLGNPGVSDPRASFPQRRLSLHENREKSETASVNSMYCDAEDCDEKCEDRCEEECNDACSVVKCNGDCNLNDLDDNCEDCLRYTEITCKEKDCVIKDCAGCKPCNEVYTKCEKVDCASPHDTVCYSPDCGITPPQQCSFSSCLLTQGHPQSFLSGTTQGMISMGHDFPMGYGLPHHFHFSLPTLQDQYPLRDRPRKRRREETPLVIQTPTQTTPPTRSPTIFNQDHLPHSHLASPIMENEFDYLCHWDPSCQMGFMDSYSLDNHVLQAHIAHIPPQSGFTCQWEACGEAEKGMDQLVDHIKTYHTSHSSQGNGHVCLWQGCNATFSNSEDLSHHLTTVHAVQPSIGGLLCQWEACGVTADGPDGLTTHLHTAHFVPAFSPPPKPPSVPPLEQDLVCQWCEVEGGEICGRQFTTADSLQQHAKDAHIAALKKKTGYLCLWAGCARRDKQFSQKGKVRSTHSNLLKQLLLWVIDTDSYPLLCYTG